MLAGVVTAGDVGEGSFGVPLSCLQENGSTGPDGTDFFSPSLMEADHGRADSSRLKIVA